jgi:YVTN family beta-propeller protein
MRAASSLLPVRPVRVAGAAVIVLLMLVGATPFPPAPDHPSPPTPTGYAGERSGSPALSGANGPSPPANSVNGVVATVPVGSQPFDIAYDTANGDSYVLNAASDNVSVISGSTNVVVASIPVGASPIGISYDPANGNLYVADWFSNNVSVISGATNAVIATVPVGLGPGGIASDNETGAVYVTNQGSDNVSVISGTTNFVVATIAVGSQPYSATYDSLNNEVYVANEGSNNVTVISGATNIVVASVSGYVGPTGVVYDGANDDLYVRSFYTIWVISGSTNTLLGTVNIGTQAADITPDCANGDLYVTTFVSNNVTVVSGTNNTIVGTVSVGSYPEGIVYDPANGDLYVMNSASGNVSVISGATNTVVATVPVGDDPASGAFASGSGDVYAVNSVSDSVSVISGGSTVSLVETGLPYGAEWSAAFGGMPASTHSTTVNFTVLPGNFSFQIVPISGYIASPSEGSAEVRETSYLILVTFTSTTLPTYEVTIEQTGLPTSTNWSAILGGTEESTTTNALRFEVAEGTYSYQVLAPMGYNVSPSSGTVTVASDYLVMTTFTSTSGPTWNVTIAETGLAAGTSWTTIFGGVERSTTNSALEFSVNGGTFAYQVLPVPGYTVVSPSGTATVNGNYLLSVAFASTTLPIYNVTIEETGLAQGTSWSVILGGKEASSQNSTLMFTVVEGTYAYQVQPVAGFIVAPSGGTVTVSGSYLISVAFSSSSAPSAVALWSAPGGVAGFALVLTVAVTGLGFGIASWIRTRRSQAPK